MDARLNIDNCTNEFLGASQKSKSNENNSPKTTLAIVLQ